jgi:hypothetical protein
MLNKFSFVLYSYIGIWQIRSEHNCILSFLRPVSVRGADRWNCRTCGSIEIDCDPNLPLEPFSPELVNTTAQIRANQTGVDFEGAGSDSPEADADNFLDMRDIGDAFVIIGICVGGVIGAIIVTVIIRKVICKKRVQRSASSEKSWHHQLHKTNETGQETSVRLPVQDILAGF